MQFRTKLLLAMMLVIGTVTGLSLYVAQRNAALAFERNLQREFQSALASLHSIQAVRHSALAEHCRALVRKPRIHAALEDNALDLLYPSAKEELRDVMGSGNEASPHSLHAEFYRFLDSKGEVISAEGAEDVGRLSAEEESRLTLSGVPEQLQVGYLARDAASSAESINEVIAMPIVSTESGDVIAALVVGFKPIEPESSHATTDLKSGIWLQGRLHLRSVSMAAQLALGKEVAKAVARADAPESSIPVKVDSVPQLLFYKRLNPDSSFPPAYEVCLYPLAESLARQRHLQWQIVGAGTILLLVGLLASHVISERLSVPVEKLAVDSEENRIQRARAEAALETTSLELRRAARFSSDASHQLKTPVAVLRAGLEELQARPELSGDMREEISSLIHQTYRLTNVVEDLLLLSRMDAGRLELEFASVNLSQLIEGWMDDLSALPDDLDLDVETDFPPDLCISGEKRYTTLIMQNLLENARKYNRRGGWIRVSAKEDGEWAVLNIRNSGRGIMPAAQEHIFERFHRGSVGEDVPGHGLGLNLARELARIHGGDLQLVVSDQTGTEFEARFRLAKEVQPAYEVA